jgi:hypothetical protein
MGTDFLAVVGIGVALVTGIGTLANFIVVLQIKLQISLDKEETRKWINGSFMRAETVNAVFMSHAQRLAALEESSERRRGHA